MSAVPALLDLVHFGLPFLGEPRLRRRAAIDLLPERERMTILLRFFKALTQEQTARVLGVSQVQVSRLERRALQKLRTAMETEG